jgi:hypothetical protein
LSYPDSAKSHNNEKRVDSPPSPAIAIHSPRRIPNKMIRSLTSLWIGSPTTPIETPRNRPIRRGTRLDRIRIVRPNGRVGSMFERGAVGSARLGAPIDEAIRSARFGDRAESISSAGAVETIAFSEGDVRPPRRMSAFELSKSVPARSHGRPGDCMTPIRPVFTAEFGSSELSFKRFFERSLSTLNRSDRHGRLRNDHVRVRRIMRLRKHRDRHPRGVSFSRNDSLRSRFADERIFRFGFVLRRRILDRRIDFGRRFRLDPRFRLDVRFDRAYRPAL